MLWGLFTLLACQMVGEAITLLTGLPLPGPVIGMLTLLCLLGLRDRVAPLALIPLRDSVDASSALLLRNLSLLFIPAGVGLIQRYDLLSSHGVGLALTVILSTVLTLIVTVLLFTAVARFASSSIRRGER